ncbi:MAG: glycosyltransferase family 39 protein [Burkholderiales bacterium]|nr:glycosyltransferase family 39 protein [Burkholderiales bacterium]
MPTPLLARLSDLPRRVVDGLCDPVRRRRVALWVALAYGLAWFLYGVIAKSSQDINADMAEMVVWAREPALGYPKHPPLLAWVVWLWFSVFPLADWAFLLLAVATVSLGIFLCFELAGEWLYGEKRAAVPFLLAAIPFYNFLGLKFDQNSALIPLWALAVWALMRSIETRHQGWAALAGAAAAAAMLTKYWSAFLLLALAVAALADPRRRAYFRSAAPWVTALVFLAAIAPHAAWLVSEDFPPIRWVAERRGAASVLDTLRALGEYAGGTAAYGAGALALALAFTRPSPAAVKDNLFPRELERRTAVALFWVPILVPVAVALPMQTSLLSLWNTPALNLLPVVMLASTLVVLTREDLTRMAIVVATVTAIVVLISPVVAATILARGVENNAAYARLVAIEVARVFREETGRPLKLIGGPFTLVSSAAFYLPGTMTFADFSPYLSPWATDARIARDGLAMVCPAGDPHCVKQMTERLRRAHADPPVEIEVTRRWLGLASPPARFLIGVVPPRTRP